MKQKTKGSLQKLLAVLLVFSLCLSFLPLGALAAGNTAANDGLTVTDVTEDLTDADRQQIFEDNMDSSVVSKSDVPAATDEVDVIVELDAESLLDVRNQVDAAMSMLDFQQTAAAKTQLAEIAALEQDVMDAIEAQNITVQYEFNYTAIVSGFSAKVPYGRIGDIEAIDGVTRVVLCDTYYPDVVGSSMLGQALSGAEIAAYANHTDYQGAGILIGILDTGLDVAHEAFANTPAVQKLQKSTLEKLLYTTEEVDGKINVTAYSYAALWYAQKNSTSTELKLLTADDLYKSGKVPFAFDYADVDTDVTPSQTAVEKYGNDHGTHVAGIAAGKTVDADGNVTFAGQSPEAQLAIFKVFSDTTNGASTQNILAALNDALLLDVDVINMSLGSGGGFASEESGSVVDKYYDLVKSAGILLDCSAGNAFSSSQGGTYGDFASVSDPDTGIISSASSYDAALSVASVNANETASFTISQGRVPYNDVSGHSFARLILGDAQEKTLAYVPIPGTGDVSDYEGLDVTGKVALVMRGGLSFEQKQLNAAAAGAAACIIYNNRDGYLLNMSVENYQIPTVCISYANGLAMTELETKTLTVSASEKGAVSMSDFSSWGPLPSLELKPEITAPGGNIYSSLPFAQYGYMSGTSMASPYLAGISAAALQYVNALFPSYSDTDKQLLVNRLLMSTADILYDESGVAYSPRKQGAGMVDLSAAVSTPAYLYVRGQEKAKIELGDDPSRAGIYTLGFTLKNLTGAAHSYTLDTQVQTETVSADGQYIAQKGYVLSADTGSIRVSGGSLDGTTVTVPAGGEAEITVTVKLSDEDKAYLAKFPNGIYVEGFVELTNNDDPSLSVPFLAFYGDWTEAPILEDADIYNGETPKMYATHPAGIYAMMYVFQLGKYPFVVPEGYATPTTAADKISLDLGGGNGISNLYYLQAGMLRGAKTADITIRDADTGETYTQMHELNVRKAMYNSSTQTVRAGMVGDIWPALTGGSSVLIPNNTHMTYDATLYVDDDGTQQNLKNTYSFNFTSDGEMPFIVDRDKVAFREGGDGRMYLDLTLADNFCLAGATLYSAIWKVNVNNGQKEIGLGSNYYDGIIPAVKEDGSSPRAYENYTYTFDVTDFYQSLTEGCFYIVAYDYAMNQCAYRVKLPENPITGITLNETAKTLPINGSVQLTATVAPKNATDQNITWTSSDETVAVVKNGLVAAKATGTATITAKSTAWPDMKAECVITVTEEVAPPVPMSDFRLNTSSVTMLAGTTYDNVRLYAYTPFNASDLELEWSSSDENVVTVKPNGTGNYLTQYAMLTAVGAGTATVTAKAHNSDASCDIAVTVTAPTGGGNFTIVDDTLVSYSGTESTVTVPDGVRIIGKEAFKNNDYILNVVLPDSVEEIGSRAFYDCNNLQTVRVPETMRAIGAEAFYRCTALTSLGLDDKGVIPKGLTAIESKSFYFCKLLQGDLVIPDTVTTIGASAFDFCSSLTAITMSDSVTELDAAGYQFEQCASVKKIVLSANLTTLPKNCFFSCSSLEEIPDLKNVTRIERACFQHADKVTAITIPETVTYLGNNAFGHCDALETVNLLGNPEQVDSTFYASPKLKTFNAPKLTTICKKMFERSENMTAFVVPDQVTYIGEMAFNNCTALEYLVFPSTYSAASLAFGPNPFNGCKNFKGFKIEEGANLKTDETGVVYTADGKTLVRLPDSFAETSFTVPEGVETIAAYAFNKKTTLTSVTLPSTLKEIGNYAFAGCTKLTAIAIPDGVTAIGDYAFDRCTTLATATFGNGLTTIGIYAFNKCAALKAANFPAALVSIGDYAFSNCSKLAKVTFREGLTSIGKYAFYSCKLIDSIILPASLTSMANSAFDGCNAAKEINCGGLTQIPDRAFANCRAVTKITMSDDVTSIGANAFYYCTKLTGISWPSKLQTVGNSAFYFCNALTDLDLSGTQLTSIGTKAFYQPYLAEKLIFPETLDSIGDSAFAYLNYGKTAHVTNIHIPASVTSIHKNAFTNASGLKSFTVADENPVYVAANGVLMLKATGEIYIWPQDNDTTEFTIPDSMTEIPDKMFQSNTSIRKVYIPASVTKIGTDAFDSSKIEEVVFEDSANGLEIGNYAFYNCQNLVSVKLPYGLKTIGSYAFSKTGLTEIVIPDSVTAMGVNVLCYNDKLASVKLSAALTSIPARTFLNCPALTEITLPAALTDCGVSNTSSAFSGCTGLANIYVAKGSLTYKSVDGILYDANGSTLRCYPEGRTADHFVIPEGTVRIGAHAFYSNKNLTSVSFPSTLERIGTKAFFDCINLKDYYFNGMTAPLLETTAASTGAYANLALYGNFVGLWVTYSTNGYIFNDYGLNLYYPEGATGYTAYVWDKYFNTEKGSVNIMDAGYFTPTDLTVVETGKRNALLTWTAVKQSKAQEIVYTVERSLAVHIQDDTQDTWLYDGFEKLAEGLTDCTYTDTTTLDFGLTYAYRVTAYNLAGETGPAAVATLYIDADPDNQDEQAVLELIRLIEALKPIENLTPEDEAYLRELLARYNALTEAQKKLVVNIQTLLDALELVGHTTELVGAKDPTCTEKGYTGDEICKVCGEVVKKGEEIPATGHTTKLVGAKDATCTEDGYTGDEICTVCGETVKTGEVIPATGHTTKLVGAKDATCTEDGYTGDEICTVCGETVKTGEVIPAKGHTTELVGAKDATCTEKGYTGDEVCSVCGETIKKGEEIPAKGHHYDESGKCTDCGQKVSNAATGDSSQVWLYTLLMVLALACITALTILPLKKNKTN